MRPLIIDARSKKRVTALKAYAKKHLYRRAIIEKMEQGQIPPPAYYNDHFMMLFDVGFKVMYTIEEHRGGWFHHLSITINSYNTLPHPVLVQEIMNEFVFEHLLEDCIVYETPNENPPTINIVEPYPGGRPE